jgi:MFS family permease
VADLRLYMMLRVCQGICAGLFSAIVPLLIKETTPFELSGFFGTFQQLFITIGVFTSCFLSFLL